MTEYVAVAASDLEAGDPWTATNASAAIFNALALTECDQTVIDESIYPSGFWFEVETLYDFDTDGTSSASLETADFEDGWEYQFFLDGLSVSAASRDLQLKLYRETTGSYTSSTAVFSFADTNPHFGHVILPHPRRTNVDGVYEARIKNDVEVDAINLTTAQQVLRAELSLSGGASWAGGKITVQRRRSYLSRP